MEHFTAIKVIEKLAPQINESNDPKGTLIKYAQESNISPAELERLGQVYNSAKTLSHLEKSANRGDSYHLLDIDDLIKDFTSHPESKPVVKVASSTIRNGGAIPNLFTVETLEKQASEVEPYTIGESLKRNIAEVELMERTNFINELPTTIHELKGDIIKRAKDIVKEIYLSNQSPDEVLTKLASDSQASIDGNKDAIEFIGIKSAAYFGTTSTVDFTKVASRKVVTDSTGFLKRTEEIQDLINVTHELSELYKSAEKRKPGDGKGTPADVVPRVGEEEPGSRDEAAEAAAISEYMNRVGGKMAAPEVKVENGGSGINLTEETQPVPEPTVDNKTNSILEYMLANERIKNMEGTQKAKEPFDTRAIDTVKSFIDNIYASKVSPKFSLPTVDRGYVNAGVDKQIASVETAAMIHKLMQDNIIASHSPKSVVSLYNSLAQVNPSMMRDENVAKFALREALQYDGITPHSYGQLVGIEKDKADTDKNQLMARKELYGKV